jgi:hypothetical protein
MTTPDSGAIKTAWHRVSYANNQDDLTAGGRTLSTGAGGSTVANSPAAAQSGMPTRLAYKRYFIRFDVVVAGGRPWRVQVVGHASEWEPGAAMPNELRGAARPPWLDGRTDALTLAIYKKIKRFAVPMKEDVVEPKAEDLIPKTDPKPSQRARRGRQRSRIGVRRASRGTALHAAVRRRGVEPRRQPCADTAMAMRRQIRDARCDGEGDRGHVREQRRVPAGW